jgi:hypothetical protein
MSHAENLARLARSIIARIEGDMASGIPYANAIMNARRRGIGGPEVWELVDAHFTELFDGMDSTMTPL